MRRQQFSWSGFHDHGQVVMKSLAPTLYSAVATQGVNGSVQKHSTTKAMEQLVLSLARKWASPQQLGQILLSSDGRVVVKLRDGKIISSLQNLLWGNAHVGETAFSIPFVAVVCFHTRDVVCFSAIWAIRREHFYWRVIKADLIFLQISFFNFKTA